MFSKFFIYRPIFAAVVSIVIMILGGVALVALPIARYPEISPPTVNISAVYPGASAATIGETVATPIEQEVNGVEGMSYMTSTSSSDGSMSLAVTFEIGTDLDIANVLVQNKVAVAESKLPEDVRRQGVTVTKRSPEITLFIALFSGDGSKTSQFLHNYAYLYLQDELKRVAGVGEVRIFGTGEFGMRIWLDPAAMKARGLTTTDVANAIREQNIEVAAGAIGAPPAPEGQGFQYTINAQGRFTEIEQFEDIIVKTGEGGELTYLREVARVELGSKTYDFEAQYNLLVGDNKTGGAVPTAAIAIYQLPGANAVEVADNVRKRMEELSKAFPAGLDYNVAYDNTDVIKASIKEVIVTLFITLALVVLTVYIFLQDFRATLIPSLTIPVSLIGTFAVMAALGFSINQLTLFGLVLVIGIVVDDAIVVVENTTRLLDEGETDPKKAATRSMIEVTGPVIATTLVLLAVFVPTIFMPGLTGRLFQQFAVTISIATVFSSINALTLSPALCGILLRPASGKRKLFIWRWLNNTLEKATGGLAAIVSRLIRVAVVGLIIFGALVFLAINGFASLPTGFVPQEDEGYCIVNVQLPDAAALQRTQKVMQQLNDSVQDIPGIKNMLAITGFSILEGSARSNTGTLMIVFEGWDERSEPQLHQRAILAQINQRAARIQEGVIMAFAPPSLPGVGMAGGFSLQLQDRGGAGMTTLEQVANEFVQDGNAQAGLQGLYTGFRANVPQLFVEVDREQVRKLDIPLSDVFGTLQAYLGSAYVNDFVRFGRIYQVRVQAEAGFRADPEDIRRLEVRNRQGEMIQLGTVLEIREELGPQTVTHFNIYPSAKINGNATPPFTSGDAMEIVANMANNKLPQTMGFEWTDLSYQEAKATGQASIIFVFSVILVYLVLAAQYESWTIPLSVCLAVPTALLGAVLAAYARGLDNNVYTQIGIVLLIGLSTKSAILIVEFAKVQRESGKSIRDAAIDATKLRFRAVLMTAFSFILGVVPLVVASGAGAESRKALGTVVFGGMLVATAVSVMTVPMLYYIIQWLAEKTGGGKKAGAKPEE